MTVGDVAAASGLKLADVEDGLRALAADTQATLQVSNAGDVVYVFPSDPRAALLARSWLLRVEPALNWLKVTTPSFPVRLRRSSLPYRASLSCLLRCLPH